MTWTAISSLLSGLVGKALAFLAPFWLGKATAENEALKRGIEQGRKDVERANEAKTVEDTVRLHTDAELDAELHRFSRKPAGKP